ncbi:hypothetical protein GCM10020331_085950 [Ectobacillus funiculus]
MEKVTIADKHGRLQLERISPFKNGSKVDAEAVKRSLERNIEVSEAMKKML